MSRKRVVVAMSGGVDSSVAAALFKERGYEVIGITMDIFNIPKELCQEENLISCCGRGAKADAVRVAAHLEIPHYIVDLKKSFNKWVVADFCEEYKNGHTPNPCIRCNQHIKFDALWKKAKKLGADFLATGHHARISQNEKSGRYLLLKGNDREKDQSYFLYTLTQEQLAHTLMPIGDFSKKDVRNKAKHLGLPIHQRPESQEICFIPDNDYIRFLRQRIPEAFRAGPIVDRENRILGQHRGILHFTIGQRRGMGLAASHPLYVLEIQSDENRIVVGSGDHLYKKRVLLSDVNLIMKDEIDAPTPVKAKIRYKHREAKAVLTSLEKNQVCLDFQDPQRAITPGQSAVFYDGEVVVGGGIITDRIDRK
ncbi:MAG: tRNA 2-thiouridine(34) synthase MnmA [Candidatus Aminicenantes bacterium]|nr:tRNA 2-thiouridine(34) synthase MnmA [Candidatus Aminicenantes bacterium]